MRSFFLGYWIPPEQTNPGKPWNVYGDSVYAENTANAAFTGAFYGLDGSGPLASLPSGNYTPGGSYRHWCEWLCRALLLLLLPAVCGVSAPCMPGRVAASSNAGAIKPLCQQILMTDAAPWPAW